MSDRDTKTKARDLLASLGIAIAILAGIGLLIVAIVGFIGLSEIAQWVAGTLIAIAVLTAVVYTCYYCYEDYGDDYDYGDFEDDGRYN